MGNAFREINGNEAFVTSIQKGLWKVGTFYAQVVESPLHDPVALSVFAATTAFASVSIGKRSFTGFFTAPIVGAIWGGYKGCSRQDHAEQWKNGLYTFCIAIAIGTFAAVSGPLFHRIPMVEESLVSAAITTGLFPMLYISAGFLAGLIQTTH